LRQLTDQLYGNLCFVFPMKGAPRYLASTEVVEHTLETPSKKSEHRLLALYFEKGVLRR